jgi:hypothetical protein
MLLSHTCHNNTFHTSLIMLLSHTCHNNTFHTSLLMLLSHTCHNNTFHTSLLMLLSHTCHNNTFHTSLIILLSHGPYRNYYWGFNGVSLIFCYAPATKSRGHINLTLSVRSDIDTWFFRLSPPTVLELQL